LSVEEWKSTGSICPGIEVGVPTYAIHHNEECYPDSFQYLPERWIAADDSEKEKVKVEKTQRAFTGFSIGPRACIGRNMAYVEMMITMARVLFQFDMKLTSTMGEGGVNMAWGRHRREEMQVKDHFNGQREGPMVEFIPIKA
jgi:cytochrome P450